MIFIGNDKIESLHWVPWVKEESVIGQQGGFLEQVGSKQGHESF
jgi:hypothetical protein